MVDRFDDKERRGSGPPNTESKRLILRAGRRFREFLGGNRSQARSDAKSVDLASCDSSISRDEHSEDTPGDPIPGIDPPVADHEDLSMVESLWDRAYNALEKDKPELVKEYEALLAKETQQTGMQRIELATISHAAMIGFDSFNRLSCYSRPQRSTPAPAGHNNKKRPGTDEQENKVHHCWP